MIKAHFKTEKLPKHKHSWNKVNPNKNEVLVVDTDEHGVDAMCKSKLVVVGSYSKLGTWVDIDITDVNSVLMIVNVINFSFVECNLCFVNFQIKLIFVFFYFFLFDELYAF